MPETVLSGEPDLVKSQRPGLAFYCPDPKGRVTGGFLYNQRLQEQLRTAGWDIEVVSQSSIERGSDVHLVDSLLAVEYMQNWHASHRRDSHNTWFLYHLPPYAGQDVPLAWLAIERQLLETGRVVVTGTQCLDLLHERHGMTKQQLQTCLSVITPGIADNWQTKTQFPLLPSKLIVLASVIPQKGIASIVEALSKLSSLNWQCSIYGETQQNPEFYTQMLEKIAALGLSQRILLSGTVAPAKVNGLMCEADLLIHCSEFETYSMVTAEAIATGLPTLSTPVGEIKLFQQATNMQYLKSRTGARLTQELFEALGKLLTDACSYQQLCQPNINVPVAKSWRDTGKQWQTLLEKRQCKKIAGEQLRQKEVTQ